MCFCPQLLGERSLDRIWQTPEFSKHLDDPPENSHFLLWKKESHLKNQYGKVAVSSLPSWGLVRITSSLSSPSSWTFVYLELWRRTFVPLKQGLLLILLIAEILNQHPMVFQGFIHPNGGSLDFGSINSIECLVSIGVYPEAPVAQVAPSSGSAKGTMASWSRGDNPNGGERGCLHCP